MRWKRIVLRYHVCARVQRAREDKSLSVQTCVYARVHAYTVG